MPPLLRPLPSARTQEGLSKPLAHHGDRPATTEVECRNSALVLHVAGSPQRERWLRGNSEPDQALIDTALDVMTRTVTQ